ncbi:MAG: type II toxin-antitoxin system HicB family antitoxin [Clostridiales bacterium]|nr:type II toxin-antitoxin system HicB family antitoxin [Clostridiales bacterium]
MAKYVYPAIFTSENDGGYSVLFPDIESCYTCGDNMPDALNMAEDVLCLMLYDMEKDGKAIPAPSNSKAIKTDDNSFVSLVGCDTEFYRRFYENKSVKKTLTIPMWLNERAERANINFSGVLQEALKTQLHIQD